MTQRRTLTVSAVIIFAVTASALPGSDAAIQHRVRAETPSVHELEHKPLAGKVIVIDPGHQLGNATHSQSNQLVNAGGFMKACNTAGTATNDGYPEATFTWLVAGELRRQLERQGARVYLTRQTNSRADLGPCIDTRGRQGNRLQASAVVSIHGDGASAGTRGFFVIVPANRPRWTADIYHSSHRLGLKVRAGLRSAGVRMSNSYGGDGLDQRGDLGTLNWSNRPTVMIEMGNMRNAIDSRHMTSPAYRKAHYARGVMIGIKTFLLHR